ncbi:MAG: GDP-L-fucose synthase [Granulosicoccus sp.]|nr:GDP-L-fucose synthase [Granulosicoccus sp.]
MSASKPVIFVAGHKGMVGRAIVRQLESQGDHKLITRDRQSLDLVDQQAVSEFFQNHTIDTVYLAAARVGGIHANASYPAEFIYQNLMMQCNVIHAAHESGVQRLLFLGSSCIYPKFAPQPMAEDSLLTGVLEETNEPYAIAKIAGIKLCQSYYRQYGRDYRCVMPTNLFGPFDNFHPENSHVIPGLIQKFEMAIRHNKPTVTIWGSGTPRREFLHVDDMASASVHIMNLPREQYLDVLGENGTHVNVGTGEDCEIRELALTLKRITGFRGEIEYDASKPDGTPRKLMNVDLLHATGWRHAISLESGLQSAWQWFLDNRDHLRLA